MDTTRLKDKVAIITGASSGIGGAIVTRFVQEGAKVVAAGRSGKEKELEKAYPDSVVAVTCDVLKEDDIEAMVETCKTRFGRLDIIVNNAGITGALGRIHEYKTEDWDQVQDTNVKGSFLTMRAGLPLMLEQGGGSIINMGSVESYIAAPGSSAYSISKGALLMLTKQAASDYFKDNIRVNIVCPGLIDTKILDGALVSREELASYVPIGRLGKPEEIAPLFAYLASDESSFVTGSSFTIDGGQTSV